MRALTGTWRLFRLALRRDRIKLPVIVGLLVFLFWSSVGATLDFYGEDLADQLQYAATTAPSIVARAFSGPIAGPQVGSIVMAETFVSIAVAIAFVSSMAVVRHTRQNEEFGRSELVGSGVVSHHAPLVAALILALSVNVVFFAAVFLSLLSYGLPIIGSLAYSLTIFGVGMSFAVVGAVAAQLADSSRGANGYAALFLGFTFLLRAVGDVGGKINPDGLSVTSSWLSWLSPFGWAGFVRPFAQISWLPIIIYGIFVAAAVILSFRLLLKRDVGSAIFATRPGRPAANKRLRTAWGLTRRLQRGIVTVWFWAIAIFGAAFGLTIKEFESFLEGNEEIQKAFSQFGTGDSYRDIFMAVLISMMSIMITGYAVQALLKARSEEANGQLESVLATGVGRKHWMLTHVLYMIGSVLLLLSVMALSMGMSYVLSVGAPWSELGKIFVASIVQVSAILAFVGFVIFVWSFLPRLVVPIAWGSLALTLMIVQLGSLLSLPKWLTNISPFVHLPAMPANEFKLEPVLWLCYVGLVLMTVGFWHFRNRDLTTE